MISFKITGEYIELIALLKAAGMVETGGHAKAMVENGQVIRNGAIETRKRAKITRGEKIKFGKEVIHVM